ncbi:hypothetical protein ROSINTL182_06633 [Roseburia intestinalis L1-82]|uniref:Uncharacterized protein n=1 Tax=Roseburia intestinalis L1-82 TaxID=536231 RepID=C7G9Q4_9FIRM|nr:hypothetical protein ROSINTL182_06633 [Roseburia intestinalis L1-82]
MRSVFIKTLTITKKNLMILLIYIRFFVLGTRKTILFLHGEFV